MKIKMNVILSIMLFVHLFSELYSAGELLPILNSPLSVRSNAMGNVYSGSVIDVFNIFSNSGMSGVLERKSFGIMTSLYYEDTILAYMGYLHPTLDYGNIYFSVLHLNSGNAIEMNEYNQPTGNKFGYTVILPTLGWGKEIYRQLSAGINFKFISSSLHNYNQYFFTVDLGMIYRIKDIISLGANFNNVFPYKLSDTEDVLPLRINLGLGVQPLKTFFLGMDFGKHNMNNNSSIIDTYSLGLESVVSKTVTLRAGRNVRETTLGFGINFKNTNFNYATIFNEYLGVSHRIAIELHFGKTLDELWAEQLRTAPVGIDIFTVDAVLSTEEEKKEYIRKLFDTAIQEYKSGNFVSSLKNFQKIKEIDPVATDIDIYIAKLNLVTKFYSKLSPEGKINSLILRGIDYFMSGDNVNSVKVLSYALSLKPDDRVLLRLLTQVEEKTGVRTEKIVLQSGLTLVEQKNNEALIAFRKRDYAKVISLCEDVLLLEPDNAIAYKRMGSAFYSLGEKEKAKQMWKKALSLDPTDKKLEQLINNLK